MPTSLANLRASVLTKPPLLWLRKNCRFVSVMVILVLACVAVMLPRLQATQFGLLDDGGVIQMVQVLSKDPWKAFVLMKALGRFIPFFLWNETLVYQWAGIHSLRWFAFNLLYLILDTLGIFWIIRYRGGTLLQSTLGGIFFCFSFPIIEAFYTLFKPDVIMSTWVIWGIIFALRSRLCQRTWLRRVFGLAAGISFLIAFGSKEPALVLVGISLGWFILARLLKNTPGDVFDFPASKSLLFSLLISSLIYLALRIYFISINPLAGSYSSNYQLSVEAVTGQALRWLSRIGRDFLYLFPLLLVLLDRKVRERVNYRLLLDGLVWMAGWIVILLPWSVLESFHTLPFAVGVAIVAGVCAGAGMQVLYQNGSMRDRLYLSLAFILALFVGQFTVVNSISTARIQLFYDQVNNQMVKFLGRSDPGSIFFFNMPPAEYVDEVILHLQYFRNRQDITVGYFKYQRPQDSESTHYYIVNPVMVNSPFPSVRNSMSESGILTWDLCLQTSLNPIDKSPSYAGVQKLRWTDFGVNLFLRKLGLEDKYSYTISDRPFIESKEMTYGWDVYEIKIDPADIASPGGFDGAGQWILSTPQGERKIAHFGLSGDVPLVGDFDGDGRTEIATYTPETRQFMIDLDLDGRPDLDFILSNMLAGDLTLVGDWNGDGIDTPGFYRPSDSSWHVINENASTQEDQSLATSSVPGVIPLAGDWDGDGDDTFGFYNPSTGDVYLMGALDLHSGFHWAYRTEPGSTPVVANWYGFGRDTLAVVKDGKWSLRPNNVFCEFPNPIPPFEYGNPGDIPVGGIW